MDHNLEDTLTYDSSIAVDFGDHSDSVVTQNVTLEGSSHGDISMEFEPIDEQQILMDTGGETVIVPDLMTDQYTLTPTSEYSVLQSQTSDVSTLDTSQSSLLSSQGENMMNLQFEPQTLLMNTSGAPAQLITVKTSQPSQVRELATVPRQVAIAPKPPTLQYTIGKQVAIAPKPTSMHKTQVVVDKAGNVVKRITFGNMMQTSKGVQQVYGQGGKQLVVIPAGGQKKLKLVQSGGQTLQAQLVRNSGQGSKIPTKLIIQGDSNTDPNQPAVITKLQPMAASTSGSPARYVTVHHAIQNNKMIISSPPKQTIRIAKPKQQIVTLKSPSSKIVPITTQVTGGTKKLVISGSGQKAVIKEILQKAQIVKSDGKLLNVSGVTSGQRTQLHQINIPGKGVQYIRLVTNSNSSNAKPATPKPTVVNEPAKNILPKTILLADGKGNLIQMPSKTALMTQPPPLVVTSSNSQPALKTQKKLVRIAPVAKPQQQIQINTTSAPLVRTGSQQSLLAPVKLSPPSSPSAMEPPHSEVVVDSGVTHHPQTSGETLFPETSGVTHHPETSEQQVMTGDIDIDTGVTNDPECDTKEALRALVEETTRDLISPPPNDSTVEIEYQRNDITDESTNSADLGDLKSDEQRPLIVIPSFINQNNYMDNPTYMQQFKKDVIEQDTPMEFSNLLNREIDREDSPTSPQPVSDNELEFRPRKPCNCAKSQCLKLYCDCFANGEFCNNCNCNSCHNNLENEELRQKAIRACLDRNPNAFRPKIGKAQNAGPEPIRRHNKGCNCKNCGCLKNYCECYEAKIACTSMCKCVGCRNVEESVDRARRPALERDVYRHPPAASVKHPCNFMTLEVIEAVCQCLVAAAVESEGGPGAEGAGDGAGSGAVDGARAVLEEFSRCLQDIVGAAHHPNSLSAHDEALA